MAEPKHISQIIPQAVQFKEEAKAFQNAHIKLIALLNIMSVEELRAMYKMLKSGGLEAMIIQEGKNRTNEKTEAK